MKKIVESFKPYMNTVLVVLLFIVSISVIVYLIPKERKFRYEFQKGAPWRHEDLFAENDFPIYKTEAELNAERDSVEARFIPYYRFDTLIKKKEINDFEKEFLNKWTSRFLRYDTLEIPNSFIEQLSDSVYNRKLRTKYHKKLKEMLVEIYNTGVIEFTDASSKGSITIVRGNVAEEFELSEIFTLKKAYEYLFSDLPLSRNLPDSVQSAEINFIREMNLNEYLLPNLVYDAETSKKVKESALESISLTVGMVQRNQSIISRGEVVDDEQYRILESLKLEYESFMGNARNYYLLLLGHVIFVFSLFFVLYLFLFTFRKDIIADPVKTSFPLLLIVLFFIIGNIITRTGIVSIYIIPFSIIAIIIRIFYDTRLALYTHIVACLLVGYFAPNGFEFLFLQFITGVIAIISLKTLRRRGQLFTSAVFITFTYSFIYFGLAMIQEGEINNIKWVYFSWFGINGLLILAAYPLIYVFERIFGFLSDVTLIELTDTNSSLLRKLAESAPGTFQHCMQVANLAEQAVYQIGGNPLLVRAGALYHDIGKCEMPQFFTENQLSGINPHDNMDLETSASLIISHVSKGIEIASKYKLPPQVIDFIRTHHGTSKTQYFLRSFISRYPDKNVNEKVFTYPGPKPFTKESAVLMMADAVEAASRSMKILKPEGINTLVDKIIDSQTRDDQFSESELTFRDISLIKTIFKQKLKNFYHARIEYPENK